MIEHAVLALALQSRFANDGDPSLPKIALFLVLGLILLVFLVIVLRYANLWVRSVTTNAGIGPFDMFAMSLRKVSPSTILDAKIMLVQARIEGITTRDIEAHLLAGGRVQRVVQALISANRAGIDLDFRTASGIDLAYERSSEMASST